MNLKELHPDNKSVSARPLSATLGSAAIAIQLLENGLLKEHVTKTQAVLTCVKGQVEYGDESGKSVTLQAGDFYMIEPMVKHWVKGMKESQLILLKSTL